MCVSASATLLVSPGINPWNENFKVANGCCAGGMHRRYGKPYASAP